MTNPLDAIAAEMKAVAEHDQRMNQRCFLDPANVLAVLEELARLKWEVDHLVDTLSQCDDAENAARYAFASRNSLASLLKEAGEVLTPFAELDESDMRGPVSAFLSAQSIVKMPELRRARALISRIAAVQKGE